MVVADSSSRSYERLFRKPTKTLAAGFADSPPQILIRSQTKGCALMRLSDTHKGFRSGRLRDISGSSSLESLQRIVILST